MPGPSVEVLDLQRHGEALHRDEKTCETSGGQLAIVAIGRLALGLGSELGLVAQGVAAALVAAPVQVKAHRLRAARGAAKAREGSRALGALGALGHHQGGHREVVQTLLTQTHTPCGPKRTKAKRPKQSRLAGVVRLDVAGSLEHRMHSHAVKILKHRSRRAWSVCLPKMGCVMEVLAERQSCCLRLELGVNQTRRPKAATASPGCRSPAATPSCRLALPAHLPVSPSISLILVSLPWNLDFASTFTSWRGAAGPGDAQVLHSGNPLRSLRASGRAWFCTAWSTSSVKSSRDPAMASRCEVPKVPKAASTSAMNLAIHAAHASQAPLPACAALQSAPTACCSRLGHSCCCAPRKRPRVRPSLAWLSRSRPLSAAVLDVFVAEGVDHLLNIEGGRSEMRNLTEASGQVVGIDLRAPNSIDIPDGLLT